MKNGKFTARRTSGTKALTMLLALTLAVACAVGGTLAWLTATSQTVTNTFTVGDINITLAETTGTSYKVVPGATVSKDPTVTVEKGSEECYVYAKVTNNLVLDNGTNVATLNVDSTKWTVVATSGNTTLYRYNQTVNALNADDNVKLDAVFTQVTYSGSDITKDNITQLKDKTIVIQAYAHQFANVEQTDADAAAKTWAGITA